MNILYVAQFHETCGYSHAALGYLKSISSVVENFKDINFKIISVSLNSYQLDPKVYKKKVNYENLKQIEKFHVSNQEELNNILDSDYICIWHMTSAMPLIEKIMKSKKASYHNGLDCTLEGLILGSTQNYHILAWETSDIPGETPRLLRSTNLN